ncbi:hypothetical protein A5883_002361, partial [Enterococcus sp. 5B3_DIV0040]
MYLWNEFFLKKLFQYYLLKHK